MCVHCVLTRYGTGSMAAGMQGEGVEPLSHQTQIKEKITDELNFGGGSNDRKNIKIR